MDDNKTSLGSFMWTELSSVFSEVLDLNAKNDHAKRAQIWAGFLAAATGAMCKDLGASDTKVILHAVSSACTDALRGEMKLVTP